MKLFLEIGLNNNNNNNNNNNKNNNTNNNNNIIIYNDINIKDNNSKLCCIFQKCLTCPFK